MIDVRSREQHYHHTESWLDTDWHFSFGPYRDPDNERFGPLRVVNNDRVDPGGGWGMHSHREMEILTWVVDGSIVHEDSTGTRRTVPRNGLQKMSAGTGIAHSEYNPSDEERLHLVQIWIEPDRSGLEPSYEEARFPEADLRNRWRAVASGSGEAPVSIRQDATMYVAHPEAGRGLSHAPQGDRRIYLVMLRGRGTVNGSTMAAGDAARIRNEDRLAFQADDDSELLMLDLPS